MLYLFPNDTAFSGDDIVETDNWKVMQFTGLKDKNGKDVFEGDIVVEHNHGRKINQEVVRFEEGGFFPFAIPQWEVTMIIEECEIIGNIYETPELLK